MTPVRAYIQMEESGLQLQNCHMYCESNNPDNSVVHVRDVFESPLPESSQMNLPWSRRWDEAQRWVAGETFSPG